MDYWFLGATAALGSAASWAGGSILFKKLGEQLSSTAMTWAKSIVSVVLLAAVLVFLGFEKMQWTPLLLLVGSGLLGIALGDTFFFEALKELEAHTVVMLLMLGQVLTVVLAVIFLGERQEPLVWVGIVLVLSGVWIVLNAKLAGSGENVPARSKLRGVTLGILSVISMAVSLIIAKPALAEVSALQATLIRMLAGMAGMLVFGVSAGKMQNWLEPFANIRLAVHFLIAVCVVTFGGFWLSLLAIKHIDVSIANSLCATEPLFVLPLAAIYLKEKITAPALIGAVIIVLGIVLMVS